MVGGRNRRAAGVRRALEVIKNDNYFQARFKSFCGEETVCLHYSELELCAKSKRLIEILVSKLVRSSFSRLGLPTPCLRRDIQHEACYGELNALDTA